jgi:hypothetical protein
MPPNDVLGGFIIPIKGNSIRSNWFAYIYLMNRKRVKIMVMASPFKRKGPW